MEPNVKIYVAHWLLLVALAGPLWHVSQAMLAQAHNRQVTDTCVTNARALLWNITEALATNNLFKGINCSEQEFELNSGTQTVTVCAPKHSTCAGITTSQFDQVSCLASVEEDLRYYSNVLSSHPDSERVLDAVVLMSLRALREKCFPWSASDEPTGQQTPLQSSFDERLRVCKVLRGFQIRSVTIARVLSYVHAG